MSFSSVGGTMWSVMENHEADRDDTNVMADNISPYVTSGAKSLLDVFTDY